MAPSGLKAAMHSGELHAGDLPGMNLPRDEFMDR